MNKKQAIKPEKRVTAQPITKEKFDAFVKTLSLGDKIYISEYEDNPDTKFGRSKVKRVWVITRFLPYTVQLQRKTETGRTEIRTVPYATLMLKET